MSDNSDVPAMLYKYRPFNERTLKSLADNTLWFPSPDTFNDPFDGFVAVPKKRQYEAFKTRLGQNQYVGNPFGDCEITTALLDIVKSDGTATAISASSLPEFKAEDELEKRTKSRGVFCASAADDNILMWSHYAAEHRGLCIGYEIDYEKLTFADVFEVKYLESDDRDVLEPDDLVDAGTAIRKLLTIKSHHWGYEKEWRLVLKSQLADGSTGEEQPVPGVIKEIIFGMRMPKDQRLLIAGIANGATLKKAVPQYRRYGLQMLSYTP